MKEKDDNVIKYQGKKITDMSKKELVEMIKVVYLSIEWQEKNKLRTIKEIEGLTIEQCVWIERSLEDAVERLNCKGTNNLHRSKYIIQDYRKILEKKSKE